MGGLVVVKQHVSLYAVTTAAATTTTSTTTSTTTTTSRRAESPTAAVSLIRTVRSPSTETETAVKAVGGEGSRGAGFSFRSRADASLFKRLLFVMIGFTLGLNQRYVKTRRESCRCRRGDCSGVRGEVLRLGRISGNAVGGGWTPWSSWSQCSRDCSRGVRSRKRACTNPEPKYGGQSCTGAAQEYQECNVTPCPEDNGETI
ncbi:hypothetical protein CRUP_038350 [Coryphaenoides rupestris]|nr:hypothetical protein CRUP_038350 [Coryphaenoides rupestris]